MKLLYVEWLDSSQLHGGVWREGSDLRKRQAPTLCTSVGFVVQECKLSITLAGHMNVESDCYVGDLCIPRCSIIKTRRVKI